MKHPELMPVVAVGLAPMNGVTVAASAADLKARHPQQANIQYAICNLEEPQGFAAADLGFTPEQGRQLAIGTVQGAAALAAQSAEPASVLRERVTSKGGTTEAALGIMTKMGVGEGIVAGVKAAETRGRELGKLLGVI